MTSHTIVISASGVGAINRLQRSDAQEEVVYRALASMESISMVSELMATLRSFESRKLSEEIPVTLVLESSSAVMAIGIGRELVAEIERWTMLNPRVPVSIYWVLVTTDRELMADFTGEISPLVALG